jgi:hypothetical protein
MPAVSRRDATKREEGPAAAILVGRVALRRLPSVAAQQERGGGAAVSVGHPSYQGHDHSFLTLQVH